jgi:hypothetical protein
MIGGMKTDFHGSFLAPRISRTFSENGEVV